MTTDTQDKAGDVTGATVYTTASIELVGQVLHWLEYQPDIHVLKRIRSERQGLEILKLRSDRFPRSWEKRVVRVIFHRKTRAVTLEPINPDEVLEQEPPPE